MLRIVALVLTTLLLPAFAGDAATLELEDCRISAGPAFPGIKARCGTLRRPENPADPNSAEIEIAVAVVPALDLTPQPDPFVPLAGGPGQGARQFYSAYRGAFEHVRRDRDILLVDQRGTGESSRMDCDIDDDIVAGRYPAELALEATQACLDALLHDPRFFTTSIAIADLEAVREALGYTQLNLYGVSYGSRVAQHFARRYPASTRSIVLDGVIPPQRPVGPEIATEAQRALDNIISRCAADAACNERFPNLQQSFIAVRAELEQQAVVVDLANPVTGRREFVDFGSAELAGAIRLLSYHSNSMAIVPLLIDEAAGGNYEPLAAQFHMIAASMTDALALGMHTICSLWPAGPIDDDLREPLATDIPVLLLSGEADPITPPRYATLAMVGLEHARHLIGEQQGHGQAGVGCMPRLIGQFVNAANPDDLDATCLERSFPMPFFLDFAGPAP